MAAVNHDVTENSNPCASDLFRSLAQYLRALAKPGQQGHSFDEGPNHSIKFGKGVSSHSMKDAEGDEGMFTGCVNDRGQAHGKGQLCYKYGHASGHIFIGKFTHGELDKGVIYDESGVARFTMEFGQWTSEVRDDIMQEFPCYDAYSSTSSYIMQDPDGDEGVFIGFVNTRGEAHGKGQLLYDRGQALGHSFVGTFLNGQLNDGVVYDEFGTAHYTMRCRQWANGVQEDDVKMFPHCFLRTLTRSHLMKDLDGDQGVFTGFVNVDGLADGIGQLRYDHGRALGQTFIGRFSNGSMYEGVVYNTSMYEGVIYDPLFTMELGLWSNVVCDGIVKKFPSCLLSWFVDAEMLSRTGN